MPLTKAILSLAVTLALAAGAQAAPKPSGAAIKAQMKTTVEPASNTLFAVGGEVDPANGPEAAKVAAARWAEAAAAAARLQAVAAALQKPAPGRDKEVWLPQARKLGVVSAAAGKAAKAHDGGALAQAANDLGDTCSACHAKYRPATP